MNFLQLQCFVGAAELRHFGRAAEHISIVPSHLSRQVQALERELNVELFDRSSRRVELTPAGEALLVYAQRVLDDRHALIEVAARAAQGAVGHMRLDYSPGTGDLISRIVNHFATENPGVDIALKQRGSIDILEAILIGEADVGIAHSRSPGLESSLLRTHPYKYLLLPQGHTLAKKAELTIEDLSGLPYLVSDRGIGLPGITQAIIEFFNVHGIHPTLRPVEFRNWDALIDYVVAGMGIALTTHQFLHRYQSDAIVAREVRGVVPQLEELLVWRIDQTSPLLRRFIEFVQQEAPRLTIEP